MNLDFVCEGIFTISLIVILFLWLWAWIMVDYEERGVNP